MDSLSLSFLRKQKKILFIARTEKCECALSPNFPLIMIHCWKVEETSSLDI